MPNEPVKLDRAVVLQVLPSLGSGGVERGTIEIVQAISRAGGIALVASAGGRLVGQVERAGGHHFTLPLASKNPLRMLGNARRLARLIEAHNVDIVHARSRAPAWSAWLACKRTGARFMTTYHAVYGEDFPGKRRYNAVMARGERVIAISRHIAVHLIATHAVDPAIVRVIHRGVDAAQFDPDQVHQNRVIRLAAEWRVPDGNEIVLLPARLSRWKGQEVMIRAMAKLGRSDVCCVLAGSDRGRRRYARHLAALAEDLGAQVRMVGDCADMPAALKLADLVVNASLEPEGFGRTVIEAQAMARMVIGTDHGGAAETIEEGVTGWLVPPGDAEALADAVNYALALPLDARQSLGRAAREAVQARFSVSAMQEATLNVYLELLKE